MLDARDKQVILRAKRLGLMPQLYILVDVYKQWYIRLSGINYSGSHMTEVYGYAIRQILRNLNYIEDDILFVAQVNNLIKGHYYKRPIVPCVKMKYN